MSTVIKVENLGKSYLVGHNATQGERYTALRDVIARNAKNIARKTRDMVRGRQIVQGDEVEEFWALRDLSFEVKQGDRVGIIGRNGAGKSTLLKILSRITEPTTGRVAIKGRVASLLEVGTGFHPELTGRENIFLNGAILGMSRKEIRRKFDEIVDFAEVEKFLDTPVKRYSSGMYVRLAFAVAAHLEPEILVVDEVLAVGDAQFQKKCLGKMEEVGRDGRTVLFVSHNMSAVKSLCSSGIWLMNGQMVQKGIAAKIVDSYMQGGAQEVTEQVWDDFSHAPGTETVRLKRVAVFAENESGIIDVTTPISMEFEVWNHEPETELNFSMHLHNQEGQCIFCTASASVVARNGVVKSVCYFPGNLFNDNVYRVMIMLVRNRSIALFSLHDVLVFEVRDVARPDAAWFGKQPGMIRPKLQWEITNINQV